MKSIIFMALVAFSIASHAQSGIEWSAATDIAPSSFGNLHPRITLSSSGNPMVIWGRASDESVFFSRWNGQAFTMPMKLNGSLKIATASWMGPQIASHGDTVYVVMKQSPENSTNSHVYIVRSEDGGMTFSSPVRVDNIADSISRFPTVTCDSKGNPVVGFMKFDTKFRDSRWVVCVSKDLGRTFTSDKKASGWKGATGVCDCCPGAVVSDANRIAMLYRNNASDIRDIWMGVSSDEGSTFTSGCDVDESNWNISSCPATGPDGVAVGDTLYTVFCSAPEGYYRTFLSRSSIAGNQWYQTRPLPVDPNGVSQQNYPRIASFGSAIGIVWKQNVLGVAQLPILFTNDIRRGFPQSNDTVDVEDVTNADIAVGSERVAVCWENPNARTVGFRMGTFSATSTRVADDQKRPAMVIYPNPGVDHVIVSSSLPAGSVISLTDMLGCVKHTVNSQELDTMINVRDLPIGIYWVCISGGGFATCQNILIHH